MKQILHRKAELIVAVLLLFTAAFAQEMEVDGDLKVQGDIIFSDETAMSSASSGIPAGILAPFAGSTAPDGWLLCDGSAVVLIEEADTLGSKGGEEQIQLTFDQMSPHTHSTGSGIFRTDCSQCGSPLTHVGGVVESEGEASPHNNMPPYMALNYLIKY